MINNFKIYFIALIAFTSFYALAQQRNNKVGINLGNPGIYYSEPVFADAMRSHKEWYDLETTTLDENYWPQEDASCFVWSYDASLLYGTYKLYFKGSATNVTSGDATISNLTYDVNSNTSSATLVYPNTRNNNLNISFIGTKRTSTSATNTGITDVQLMRPTALGSNMSYTPSTIFTSEFIKNIEPFKCLRTLGWVSTNSCGDSLWSDRTTWKHATQSPPALPNRVYGWEGRGASWESIIKLANLTGKDLWINIPHKATADYITNLAFLFKNGNADCEPLRSDLKLYVEYSNEIWNNGLAFTQTNWSSEQGKRSEFRSILSYDGEMDEITWMHRFKTMKTVEMSQIFRDVFGDAKMMTQVRPLMCWQQAYSDLTNRSLSFIDRYYNKRDSRSPVATPHPVNYYLYGGGGSFYWYPIASPTLTGENLWTSGGFDAYANFKDIYNNEGGYAAKMRTDAAWAKQYGLEYALYEGDVHPEYAFDDDKILTQTHFDPRMKQNTYDHLKLLSELEVDVPNFLNLKTDSTFYWGVINANDPENSPQYDAIKEFINAKPYPLTLGDMVPFTKDADIYDTPYRNLNGSGKVTIESNTDNNYSYLFRVPNKGNYSAAVTYKTNSTATLALEIAGNVIATLNLPNTNDEYQTIPGQVFTARAEKIYSLRIVALAGSIDVGNIILSVGGVVLNPISVSGLSVSVSQNSVSVSKTINFSSNIFPINATNQTINWTSSNDAIATFGTTTGILSGISEGTITATGTSADGGFSESVVIKVTPAIVSVTSINISVLNQIITVGGFTSVSGSVFPANASNKTIRWQSSSIPIAKVNFGSGIVSAISEGVVTITGSSQEGNKKSFVLITVVGITKQNPLITFSGTTLTVGGANVDLNTLFISNSNGIKSFSVNNANASISGSNLVALAAGSVTVTGVISSISGFSEASKKAIFTIFQNQTNISILGISSTIALSNTANPIQITISGMGFVSGTTITIGGVMLTNVVVNGNIITGTIPAGVTISNPTAPTVIAQNPGFSAFVASNIQVLVIITTANTLPSNIGIEQISIMPNPSTGTFTLTGGKSITVRDILGKTVLSTTEKTFTITLKGLYIAQVFTDLGSISVKLVVE